MEPGTGLPVQDLVGHPLSPHVHPHHPHPGQMNAPLPVVVSSKTDWGGGKQWLLIKEGVHIILDRILLKDNAHLTAKCPLYGRLSRVEKRALVLRYASALVLKEPLRRDVLVDTVSVCVFEACEQEALLEVQQAAREAEERAGDDGSRRRSKRAPFMQRVMGEAMREMLADQLEDEDEDVAAALVDQRATDALVAEAIDRMRDAWLSQPVSLMFERLADADKPPSVIFDRDVEHALGTDYFLPRVPDTLPQDERALSEAVRMDETDAGKETVFAANLKKALRLVRQQARANHTRLAGASCMPGVGASSSTAGGPSLPGASSEALEAAAQQVEAAVGRAAAMQAGGPSAASQFGGGASHSHSSSSSSSSHGGPSLDSLLSLPSSTPTLGGGGGGSAAAGLLGVSGGGSSGGGDSGAALRATVGAAVLRGVAAGTAAGVAGAHSAAPDAALAAADGASGSGGVPSSVASAAAASSFAALAGVRAAAVVPNRPGGDGDGIGPDSDSDADSLDGDGSTQGGGPGGPAEGPDGHGARGRSQGRSVGSRGGSSSRRRGGHGAGAGRARRGALGASSAAGGMTGAPRPIAGSVRSPLAATHGAVGMLLRLRSLGAGEGSGGFRAAAASSTGRADGLTGALSRPSDDRASSAADGAEDDDYRSAGGRSSASSQVHSLSPDGTPLPPRPKDAFWWWEQPWLFRTCQSDPAQILSVLVTQPSVWMSYYESLPPAERARVASLTASETCDVIDCQPLWLSLRGMVGCNLHRDGVWPIISNDGHLSYVRFRRDDRERFWYLEDAAAPCLLSMLLRWTSTLARGARQELRVVGRAVTENRHEDASRGIQGHLESAVVSALLVRIVDACLQERREAHARSLRSALLEDEQRKAAEELNRQERQARQKAKKHEREVAAREKKRQEEAAAKKKQEEEAEERRAREAQAKEEKERRAKEERARDEARQEALQAAEDARLAAEHAEREARHQQEAHARRKEEEKARKKKEREAQKEAKKAAKALKLQQAKEQQQKARQQQQQAARDREAAQKKRGSSAVAAPAAGASKATQGAAQRRSAAAQEAATPAVSRGPATLRAAPLTAA